MSFAFLSPICCRPFSSLREPELRTCRIFCLDCSSTDVSSWDSQPFSIIFSLPSGGWKRKENQGSHSLTNHFPGLYIIYQQADTFKPQFYSSFFNDAGFMMRSLRIITGDGYTSICTIRSSGLLVLLDVISTDQNLGCEVDWWDQSFVAHWLDLRHVAFNSRHAHVAYIKCFLACLAVCLVYITHMSYPVPELRIVLTFLLLMIYICPYIFYTAVAKFHTQLSAKI